MILEPLHRPPRYYYQDVGWRDHYIYNLRKHERRLTWVILTRGPRLVKSPLMTRWHRPRSGWWHHVSGYQLSLWCRPDPIYMGGGCYTKHPRMNRRRGTPVDEVPAGELLCGTCEGRAVGAGHIPLGVEPKDDVGLIYVPELDNGCGRPRDLTRGKGAARTRASRATPCVTTAVRRRTLGQWAGERGKAYLRSPEVGPIGRVPHRRTDV
jgi:hypothetical protein